MPRVYLDQFGKRLFVFDKLKGTSFETTSKNLALEKGFYDLDPSIDFEAHLAKQENNLFPGVRELITKRNPTAISGEAKAKISLYIALQYLRTRAYRDMIRETGGKLATTVIEEESRFQGFDFKVEMTEELAQAFQATAMVDETVPMGAWMVGNSRWSLLVNKSKVPFCTSDNPIALYNPQNLDRDGAIGFNAKGNQTHFALSNDLLLQVLDPTSYDPRPIAPVREDQVIFENKLQLYASDRFVFSSRRDLSWARNLWEKDPTLQRSHERVVVNKISDSGRTFIRIDKANPTSKLRKTED